MACYKTQQAKAPAQLGSRDRQQQALVQQLTYNAKHQLIELTETHHGQFQQKLIFEYDALGRRIWKKVYQKSSDQERYDYAEHAIWRGNQRVKTRFDDRFGNNEFVTF